VRPTPRTPFPCPRRSYFYLIALESKVPSTTPPPPAVLSKRGAKKRA
jgi:hypothetical protein